MQLKIFFLILSFGFLLNHAHGQSYPALEKVLAKELSNESEEDGRWVFYPGNGDIKKIDKPLVKEIIPDYDFFQVTLTNFLGYHVNQGICLILFDSSMAKIVLVEPIWYRDISQPLVKMFIGKKFGSMDSLFKFLTELNELMGIGSGFKFRNTSIADSLITFDLGYFKGDAYTTGGNGTKSTVQYNEDGVWRKIMIDIKEGAIIRYTSINPKGNDKEIIE